MTTGKGDNDSFLLSSPLLPPYGGGGLRQCERTEEACHGFLLFSPLLSPNGGGGLRQWWRAEEACNGGGASGGGEVWNLVHAWQNLSISTSNPQAGTANWWSKVNLTVSKVEDCDKRSLAHNVVEYLVRKK
uniref:Uncharacterized protein n=1 Tax=Oryza meridionalis TaxID=40149 RepID=A0A0E0DPW7_9ORYZ